MKFRTPRIREHLRSEMVFSPLPAGEGPGVRAAPFILKSKGA